MAPHRIAAGALASSLLRLRSGGRTLQPLERSLGGLRRSLTSGTPYNAVTVGVPKESYPGERRVSITPHSVAALLKVRRAPLDAPAAPRERTRRSVAHRLPCAAASTQCSRLPRR
jgi:hypothetical protein